LNSPYSFRSPFLFSSTSGLSFFKKMFRHWFIKLEGVTVKLTKVTREQRSGANDAF
jgi:hypothetical protein